MLQTVSRPSFDETEAEEAEQVLRLPINQSQRLQCLLCPSAFALLLDRLEVDRGEHST